MVYIINLAIKLKNGSNSGDFIEVTFCSIDRDGNFVHPVVQTVRHPQIDGPDL